MHQVSPATIALIICIVLGGLGYSLLQARHLIRGPLITLDGSGLAAPIQGPVTTIRGTTKNTARLTLNDRDIFVDMNGAFAEDVAIPVGYTEWELSAWDRFGRTKTERVPLVRVE